MIDRILKELKESKRVYLCGNGGSAANAIHIANDLISCGVKAHALTGDIATLTAIANDFGYEHIFSRQISVFGEPGDMLIALSGSGNSPNIMNAIKMAKGLGMKVWAIVGGGEAVRLTHTHILTDPNMQHSEEKQLYIGHELMRCLKQCLKQ